MACEQARQRTLGSGSGAGSGLRSAVVVGSITQGRYLSAAARSPTSPAQPSPVKALERCQAR